MWSREKQRGFILVPNGARKGPKEAGDGGHCPDCCHPNRQSLPGPPRGYSNAGDLLHTNKKLT